MAGDDGEMELEEDNEQRVNEVGDRGPQPGAAPEEDGPDVDGADPLLDFRFEALGQGDNETDGQAADALRALCRAQVEARGGGGGDAPPVDEAAVEEAVRPPLSRSLCPALSLCLAAPSLSKLAAHSSLGPAP